MPPEHAYKDKAEGFMRVYSATGLSEKNKLTKNKERDSMNIELLKQQGWRIFVVWECSFRETKKIDFDKINHIADIIIKWVKCKENRFEEIRG